MALLDGSDSGSLMGLQSKCWLGLQSSEGLTGTGDLLPAWLPHMPGKLLLVVGRGHLSYLTVLSMGRLS